MSRESHRIFIVAVLDALSACSEEFFVHRLILQTPVGFDVGIVTTTLGEKEGKTLRKRVIAIMHMSNVIIFMDEQMRESASADVIFVASSFSESMEVLTNIT